MSTYIPCYPRGTLLFSTSYGYKYPYEFLIKKNHNYLANFRISVTNYPMFAISYPFSLKGKVTTKLYLKIYSHMNAPYVSLGNV